MSDGLVCGFVWWDWDRGRLQAHRCQKPEAHAGGHDCWCGKGKGLS